MQDQEPYKPANTWIPEDELEPTTIDAARFVLAWEEMQAEVHHTARSRGWWNAEHKYIESIAMMYSDLSKALIAIQQNNPDDDILPLFGRIEMSLVDVVIRIMDLAEGTGFNLSGAMIHKVTYNRLKSYRMGRLVEGRSNADLPF